MPKPSFLTSFLLLLVLSAHAAHGAQTIRMTGVAPAGMESYDRIIPDLMMRWHNPGGAVAVARGGRLVFARGYGLADTARNLAVEPDSLFRIGSVSKPITAVAVLQLFANKKRSLDDRAFDILDDLKPLAGKTADRLIKNVTVRDLLQHSGGWDLDATFDPMFRSKADWKAAGVVPPPICKTVIRYMLGQPLDFTPGTTAAYSNFGYCVLGRIIEKVSGMSYESYVKTRVLARMGITHMRLARTLPKDSVPGEEVHYYDTPQGRLVNSVFPSVKFKVPPPYGGFYIEAMDATAGWLGSAVDLVRFANSLDGGKSSAFLTRAQASEMVRRPNLGIWRNREPYLALGWWVRPMGSGANWWHAGTLDGSAAFLVHIAKDDVIMAALFNSLPKNADAFIDDLDRALGQALAQVTEWPTRDLFPQYK